MNIPRIALVTGASSGVGRSIVAFLRPRFEVVALARRGERMAEAFGGDPGVHRYAIDLADGAALARVLDRIVAAHGYIPYLINNAGIMLAQRVETLADDQFARSFAVNVAAPLAIMRGLLPEMRRQGFGRIVNVTSGGAFNCSPGYAAYSATKAALNALTLTAAREQADADIKINLMSPGPVRSEMAPQATLDPAVCHPTLDWLLSLPADGPTGRLFWLGRELPLTPDLAGLDWGAGTADARFRQVV